MSTRSASSADSDTSTLVSELEIDVDGRWDALALSEILIPYRSFLVQHHADRWVVHAHAPGARGESLESALDAVEDWARAHAPDTVSCRVDGRPYELCSSDWR
jgi:hypothetical protein